VGLQLSLLAAPTLFNNKAPTISDPRAPYNMLIIYSPIIERESQLFITYVVAASAAVSLFFLSGVVSSAFVGSPIVTGNL
jgi:hypothetical protein